MKRTHALALTLATAALGCGTTSTHRVVIGPVAPAQRGGVLVLSEGAALPDTYAEVAIVQAIGRGTHADAEHVLEGLRAEAATLGCDAVVRVHIDQGTNQTSATGVAIRRGVGPVRPQAVSPVPPTSPSSDTLTAPWARPQQ